LQQARQAELQANQPGKSEAARREGLRAARESAVLALAAAPDSAEAKRLLARIDTDLDRLDGVSRLREPKLLFDLNAPQAGSQETSAGTQPGGGTTAISEIVVTGNDAYVLDKGNGRIYRCQFSTQACSPTLQIGDSVTGQTVGTLIFMAQRVGNVVVLDDKLTSFIFDPDSAAWSAQPLGGASTLVKPVDVATYDGHLYLLGAKTGQVSKYSSGSYGLPPIDWIGDAGSVAQVKDPVAIAIDGAVFLLLADGRVLVMQGGKVTSTLTPSSDTNAVPADLFTDTATRDLYILYPASSSITRVTKEGQTLVTLKAPEGQLQSLSGIAVDEGKSKLYLLDGRKVYEAVLPGRPAQDMLSDETVSDPPADLAPAGPPVQAQPTAAP
jgi:hypothetical protein